MYDGKTSISERKEKRETQTHKMEERHKGSVNASCFRSQYGPKRHHEGLTGVRLQILYTLRRVTFNKKYKKGRISPSRFMSVRTIIILIVWNCDISWVINTCSLCQSWTLFFFFFVGIIIGSSAEMIPRLSVSLRHVWLVVYDPDPPPHRGPVWNVKCKQVGAAGVMLS